MSDVNSAAGNKPLISVIVPVYKTEKYLDRCIKSIINQTYKNIEIILIDDGSPDSCGRICDSYAEKDKRIKVIHKENGGVASARNTGLDNICGEYAAFVDSDDYVTEDYIEYLYSLIKKDNTDISVCSYKSVYANGTEIHNANTMLCKQIFTQKEAMEHILYDTDGTMLWGKLYKASVFDGIRCPIGRNFEDVAVVFQLYGKVDRLSVGNAEKYFYMIRENSITSEIYSPMFLDHIVSTEEMTDYISKKFPELQSACNRRIMYAYVNVLRREVFSENRDKELEKRIVKRVKSIKNDILKNPKCSKRDKCAVLSLTFGVGFFRFAWNLYAKITHRT